MKLTKTITLFLIVLIILSINSTCIVNATTTPNNGPRVVMLIISRVSYDDMNNMQNTRDLIDKSYIGLMNIRAAGRYSEVKSYATLGWGTRAEVSENTALFEELNENTREIYKRRVGVAPNSKEGIINLNINQLLQQNLKGEFAALPGAMGDLLRENGYSTSVIGNNDTDTEAIRAAGLIAMDKNGFIDFGNVSREILVEDSSSPFGIRTNYKKLLAEFKTLYDKSHLTVIDTGDLSRLEKYKGNLNSDTYIRLKEDSLKSIDIFLGDLLQVIDFKDTIFFVLTPYPSDASYEAGDRLTPVILYDGIDSRAGVLTSSTTRRKGIIGNIDIAPTILQHFNIAPENMTGRIISTRPMDNNLDYIRALKDKTLGISIIRYRILYTFAVFEMFASVLALLVIIYRNKVPRGLSNFSAALLLSTIIIPVVFLLLGILGEGSILKMYLSIIIVTTVLTVTVYNLFKRDPLKALMYASLLSVIALTLDIITGQNLIKYSILGYDPIIGARYYGIGNEFSGVLLGSALTVAAIFHQRFSRNSIILITFFIALILSIGLPNLGANVGATITALLAFLFTYSLLTVKNVSLKRWATIISVAVATMTALALFDFFLLDEKSHLAGAIEQIVEGGPLVLYQIIVRKISMNIRVMGVTIWSRVLLLALVIMGVLFYRPIGLLKGLAIKYPSLLAGWSGIILASIVGFAVNDSGVVMAATCIIFLTTSILYLLLTEEKL